jgi:flagellar biosynthesis/type III secretory pathway M-ring protein FliF/YscJ
VITSLILQLFLYFPEDKSEYIPAAITFTIFFIAAIFVFRWIMKVSNKESEKAKELEERLKRENIIKE